MNFDPHVWHWPQWAALILMFLALMVHAVKHGKPMVDEDGDPQEYNGIVAICRFAMWLFILIAGGFYGA